jgi:hypothetical protein
MASDVAARDNYLTLALLSRRIIEALKDLVLKNKRDRLKSALPAAIQSLQAATDSQRVTGYGLRVARSYDQVRTINELFPKQDRIAMIGVLEALLDDKAPSAHEEALKVDPTAETCQKQQPGFLKRATLPDAGCQRLRLPLHAQLRYVQNFEPVDAGHSPRNWKSRVSANPRHRPVSAPDRKVSPQHNPASRVTLAILPYIRGRFATVPS